MRAWSLVVTGGLAAAVGCFSRPADPPPTRPAGDTDTPGEEFRLAHETLTRLTRRLDELRAAADPELPFTLQQPEVVPLSRALSAAQKEVGRLGREVGMADPTGPLGADALFGWLLYSAEPLRQRVDILDLIVRHHPNDPRIGEYLLLVFEERVPADTRQWLDPVLGRILSASSHPAVLAAAQAGRGRLLMTSADPAEEAAGLILLEAVARGVPDEPVGRKVAAWASQVLTHRLHPHGRLGSPTVRMKP